MPQQDQERKKFYWNTVPESVYQKGLKRLFDQWINVIPLKSIALKAIHVMQPLFLQEPSRNSKAQNHLIALERRLKLWDEGLPLDHKGLWSRGNEFAKNIYEIQSFNAEGECQWSTPVIDKQHE